MSPEQKELLRPFAELYAAMDERLQTLTPDGLAELLRACEATSKTNCWAATYRAAQVIRPLIGEWQRYHRQAAAPCPAVGESG